MTTASDRFDGVQLPEHRLLVRLDRVDRHAQVVGDLAVGEVGRKELEEGELAVGQRLGERGACGGAAGRCHLGEQRCERW